MDALTKRAEEAEEKRDAARDVPLEGADEALLAVYRTSFASPSAHAMGREAMERLESAFDRLPEDYREVIVLSRICGLSRAEVAASMQRSEASVRNLNGTFVTHFGEDCQTFFVEQTSATQINWGYGGYTSADINTPEFGFSHVHAPQNDQAGWNADSYRRCCTANAWVGGVLCARMMGLVDNWAHPALFQYQDRYMQTEPAGWTRSWSTWVGAMWDMHRASF